MSTSSWVIVELTPRGEKDPLAEVRASISKSLQGAEVYIPAVETQVGEDKVVHYLMDGYAFIRYDREDNRYFRLEESKYVARVLEIPGAARRKVATVPSSYLDDLREKLKDEVNQGIGIGDTVRICSGPYKNLTASVITEIPEAKQVQVYVQLRSKKAILTLPRSVLEVVDRAPLSSYYARIGALKAWSEMARVVLRYSAPHDRLLELRKRYESTSEWLTRGALLFSYLYSESLNPRQETLVDRQQALVRLEKWCTQGTNLFTFIYSDPLVAAGKLSAIQAKKKDFDLISGMDQRIKDLSQEVEDIARSFAKPRKGKGVSVQNVLIDGFNLSFRCFFAPGMKDLHDSQGRPTGVVLGFLRGVGALKKRFPSANFWVAWDGSSQRRKSQYPDYKSNRKSSDKKPVFDQIEVIKKTLPLLGVSQAWHPDEEADDVIGTLVRKDLKKQVNLIYSTDRDFLQLVTANTSVLFPAKGSRREVMYDVATVEKNLGVPPEKVVQLRSFYGDTSDNLPGVPRVPKKVLLSLLKNYGSVGAVYSSGLSGVTKVQYERLRASEPQVRINLELMSIQDVEFSKVDPDVDVRGATQLLKDLEINPDSILAAFFGRTESDVGEPELSLDDLET